MSVGGVQIGSVCRKLFIKMDRNHDGAASRDEVKQSGVFRMMELSRSPEEDKKAFDRADLNHDGTLSESESNSFFLKLLSSSKRAMALALLLTADVPDEGDLLTKTTKEKIKDQQKIRAEDGGGGMGSDEGADLPQQAIDKMMAASAEQIAQTQAVLEARQAGAYAESAARSEAAVSAAESRSVTV